jgi:hypothetical protein
MTLNTGFFWPFVQLAGGVIVAMILVNIVNLARKGQGRPLLSLQGRSRPDTPQQS